MASVGALCFLVTSVARLAPLGIIGISPLSKVILSSRSEGELFMALATNQKFVNKTGHYISPSLVAGTNFLVASTLRQTRYSLDIESLDCGQVKKDKRLHLMRNRKNGSIRITRRRITAREHVIN